MRRPSRTALIAGCLLLATCGAAVSAGAVAPSLAAARPAAERSAADWSTAGSPEPGEPVPVRPSERPPPGRSLSSDDVLEIAGALAVVRRLRAPHPGSSAGAYLVGDDRWEVDYFGPKGERLAEIVISDRNRHVLAVWTGVQAAWTMARGRAGAFGGLANALWLWLPLCFLFLAPFLDWRRPLQLVHLDLLALLSFSISLAFFNHALIDESVPLAYPPLLYLLARMLWLTWRRQRLRPLRACVRTRWLLVGLALLVPLRIALNVTNGNVIDVGYAGVIGASRIVHGEPLYGGYPRDNAHGDTYGPVAYEAYVPFEQLFGWDGTWESLPAAHAAAVFFDLLAMVLLFVLGRRVRGPSVGVALAYAWAAYPFTLLTMNSDSNDALLAVCVLVALLCSRPVARGAWSALAGLTKLAPFVLAPLLAGEAVRSARRGGRALALLGFALGFALAAGLALVPALLHDSVRRIYERTLGYQAGRQTPFSVWGLYGLRALRVLVEAASGAFAVLLALLPRERGLGSLAAASAALLIAVQLCLSYWFYLYIAWFFPLVLLALAVAPRVAASPAIAAQPTHAETVPALPTVAASGSARSSLRAAAASR